MKHRMTTSAAKELTPEPCEVTPSVNELTRNESESTGRFPMEADFVAKRIRMDREAHPRATKGLLMSREGTPWPSKERSSSCEATSCCAKRTPREEKRIRELEKEEPSRRELVAREALFVWQDEEGTLASQALSSRCEEVSSRPMGVAFPWHEANSLTWELTPSQREEHALA